MSSRDDNNVLDDINVSSIKTANMNTSLSQSETSTITRLSTITTFEFQTSHVFEKSCSYSISFSYSNLKFPNSLIS